MVRFHPSPHERKKDMLDVANFSDNIICVLRAMLNETSWMLNREHKPNEDLLKSLRASVNGERKRRGLARIKVDDAVKYEGPEKFDLLGATDEEVIYIEILADTIIDFSMLGSGVRVCVTLIDKAAIKEMKKRRLTGVALLEEFMASG